MKTPSQLREWVALSGAHRQKIRLERIEHYKIFAASTLFSVCSEYHVTKRMIGYGFDADTLIAIKAAYRLDERMKLINTKFGIFNWLTVFICD